WHRYLNINHINKNNKKMKIHMFYHSIISDWNHGNAHFLRGMVCALRRLGHEVKIYEPVNGWSLRNLIRKYGATAMTDFKKYFPDLLPEMYDIADFEPGQILHDADLVIVHE